MNKILDYNFETSKLQSSHHNFTLTIWIDLTKLFVRVVQNLNKNRTFEQQTVWVKRKKQKQKQKEQKIPQDYEFGYRVPEKNYQI